MKVINQINKKTLFIILGVTGAAAALIVVVALAGDFKFSLSLNPSAKQGSEAGEFLTYNNAEKGIAIQYPSQWQMSEKGSSDPTVIVTFLSPIEVGPNIKINLRVQMVEEGDRTLAGLPGHYLVYADTQQGVPVKWLTVWTTKDTKAYLVTFSSTVADYDKLLPTVQKMIDSFQTQ